MRFTLPTSAVVSCHVHDRSVSAWIFSTAVWRNANGDTELWNPTGSGGFTYQDLGVVNTSWQIAGTGDFSGNGQSGILWRNTNGDTELWNPNGSGGFTFQDLSVVSTSLSVHKIFA